MRERIENLLLVFGVHPEAVTPAIVAFIKSSYYTLASISTLILLQMIQDGALVSVPATVEWLKIKLWPFVVTGLIAPTLRARTAIKNNTP